MLLRRCPEMSFDGVHLHSSIAAPPILLEWAIKLIQALRQRRLLSDLCGQYLLSIPVVPVVILFATVSWGRRLYHCYHLLALPGTELSPT